MQIRVLPAIAALTVVAGCAPAPQRAGLAAPAPAFDAYRFFTGPGHGEAVLKVAFKAPVPVHVRSQGTVAPDGALVLDQTIVEGTKRPRTRQWRIRQTGPGRYAGTLSDAVGPVALDATGNCLHIRFRMTGGLDAEQWLYLQPGGRVALNRMAIGKWGVRIATLQETISQD